MTETKEEDKTKSKMEELLASADMPAVPKVNEVVDAEVINVSSNEVHLDVAGLTTGVVRGRELIDESGTYSDLNIGDKVQATVLDLENEKGEMELSFRQAGHQKAWENLVKLMQQGDIVGAPVTEANKGGLMVKVGQVDGFLPVSQLTVEHYPRVEGGDKNRILEKLNQFIGTELKVKVIDIDEAESKLIVSEKAAWEEQQQEVISKYKVGDTVDGVITGVVDFGAFIEFGEGLEGLVHISELAWQRIDSPSDYVKVGEKVKAKIISIERSRISLSMKALKTDPWQAASRRYEVGQIVEGKVLKINPFGIFVELDKDIHGLAHISELSHERINNPQEVVKESETYKFKVLSIEPENHRLGLSKKAVSEKFAKSGKDEDKAKPVDEEKSAQGEATSRSGSEDLSGSKTGGEKPKSAEKKSTEPKEKIEKVKSEEKPKTESKPETEPKEKPKEEEVKPVDKEKSAQGGSASGGKDEKTAEDKKPAEKPKPESELKKTELKSAEEKSEKDQKPAEEKPKQDEK